MVDKVFQSFLNIQIRRGNMLLIFWLFQRISSQPALRIGTRDLSAADDTFRCNSGERKEKDQ